MGNDVAGQIEVGKSVLFHLIGEELVASGNIEVSVQMPFALIGRIVAGFTQHMSDCWDVRRQIPDIGHIGVFKHAIRGS